MSTNQLNKSTKTIFCEIEQTPNLQNITSNGVPVWQFLRNVTYSKIQSLDIDDRIPIQVKIKKILSPKSWSLNPKQSDYVLFTDRNELVKSENGLYIDKIAQNIINALSKKMLIVVNSLSGFGGTIKNGNNYLDTSYFHFKRRLNNTNKKPVINQKEKLRHALDNIGLGLEKYQFEKDIQLFFSYHSIFNDWLSRINPKAVFINCGYSLFHQALIYSCSKKNIKTVELQHGLISDGHIQYSPTIDMGKDTFPDHLLTFSDYHSKFINNNFINSAKIYPIGHYYREQKKKEKNSNSTQMIQDLRKKYNKIILVSSQNIIEHELFNSVQLLAERRPNYAFILKQREDSYLNLNYKNIIVEHNHSIYDFINLVDVNLSCFSTSILEFLSNKTIGVLMDFGNLASDYYTTIKEDCNNIFICQNTQEALSVLDQKQYDYSNPEFYKDNNKQNVESFLFNILL